MGKYDKNIVTHLIPVFSPDVSFGRLGEWATANFEHCLNMISVPFYFCLNFLKEKQLNIFLCLYIYNLLRHINYFYQGKGTKLVIYLVSLLQMWLAFCN